ncbi:MAG: endolytic transglycosylase MltG, partial [Chitinophagaceae bacterium]
ALALSKEEVYTLASIVEEETNKQDDKGKIASVYLNRVRIGMKLAADPTVKFAMRDFTLKRIYNKHLTFPSPYNTYLNKGLPPGPICTPSIKTIDATLNAPQTEFIFFVARDDFSGYSDFSVTYEQHLIYANEYREALDREMRKRDSLGK